MTATEKEIFFYRLIIQIKKLKGFKCSCGCEEYREYNLTENEEILNYFQSCKKCSKKQSVKKGTAFEGSRLSVHSLLSIFNHYQQVYKDYRDAEDINAKEKRIAVANYKNIPRFKENRMRPFSNDVGDKFGLDRGSLDDKLKSIMNRLPDIDKTEIKRNKKFERWMMQDGWIERHLVMAYTVLEGEVKKVEDNRINDVTRKMDLLAKLKTELENEGGGEIASLLKDMQSLESLSNKEIKIRVEFNATISDAVKSWEASFEESFAKLLEDETEYPILQSFEDDESWESDNEDMKKLLEFLFFTNGTPTRMIVILHSLVTLQWPERNFILEIEKRIYPRNFVTAENLEQVDDVMLRKYLRKKFLLLDNINTEFEKLEAACLYLTFIPPKEFDFEYGGYKSELEFEIHEHLTHFDSDFYNPVDLRIKGDNLS